MRYPTLRATRPNAQPTLPGPMIVIVGRGSMTVNLCKKGVIGHRSIDGNVQLFEFFSYVTGGFSYGLPTGLEVLLDE